MREGSVFRLCTRCKRRATSRDRRCSSCGHERFSWGYVVDLAPPGAPRNQRQRKGFGKKEEALADMHRAQTEKADGTYVEPSKLTLGAYLLGWVEKGCGGVRPWTLKGYESIVRVHIVPRLGHVPLQRLTRQQIKAFYEELRTNGYTPRLTPDQLDRLQDLARRYRLAVEAGVRSPVRALVEELRRPEATVRSQVRRCRELGLLADGDVQPTRRTKRRGLSPKSVWNVHVCLRAALYDAMEDGPLLKANPAKGAMKEPAGHEEMQTWTREELLGFLGFVRRDRLFALYRLAASSGMRRGELMGLRWVDVKFHHGSLSVQQQLGLADDEEDEDADGEALVLAPVKTRASRRSIKLDAITLAVLQEHRATQEFERRSWGDGYRDHDLVFCRPEGTPLDPDTVSDQFERLIRRAGLKRIRFHDLRHTHATLLLEAHVDITVVSRRLGHASVQITADRYAHVTERLQHDAAERFSTYVDGGQPVTPPGICDPVVTPLPAPAHPGAANGANSNTESGSGARIRTVNLAVNSRLLYR
jgi:integrase